MPELLHGSSHKCDYCGNPATHISVNSKKYRCAKSISKCTAVIEKQNETRARDADGMRKRMKAASEKGQAVIRELEKDPEWRAKKSKNITRGINEAGGRSGEKNSSFGLKRSDETRARMRASASVRDNSKIGKYVRTIEHRKALALKMADHLQNYLLKGSRDTKPELAFNELMTNNNIELEKQFRIQYGRLGSDGDWFIHAYDFKLKNHNVLIEIDGDYWHTLPKVVERDRVCEKVAVDYGFTIVRFWEREVYYQPDMILEKIKRLMQNSIYNN